MQHTSPTACVLIIGNEILSGRTQDKNLSWLAAELGAIGIKLAEARVIPDIESVIIAAVNECRGAFTYIFTTGGIGPTHDDITSACIAKAFGVPLIRHPEAVKAMEARYEKSMLNEARLKMADVPEGATLIANPVSAAPGFTIANVHVMAGIPGVMQAMFDGLKHTLKGGPKVLSRSITAVIGEGTIADDLTAIQNRHPDVDIGSYPFTIQQRWGTSLVSRSTDKTALDATCDEIKAMLAKYTSEVTEDDI